MDVWTTMEEMRDMVSAPPTEDEMQQPEPEPEEDAD